MYRSYVQHSIHYTLCTDHMYNTVFFCFFLHTVLLQHSTHCTVCTDLMYKTVHTVQYVQISCTTQCTLYSVYSSMYSTVHTVQYVQLSCTTQYTLYSMDESHVQRSAHCIACTDIMYITVYTVQYIKISCPPMFMTIACCASQKIATSNAHNHTVSSNMIYSLVCPVMYSIHNICPL